MDLAPRRLGSTGLQVSPLGLGLAALGRPGYITLQHAADLEHDYDVPRMRARAHALLDVAWEAGLRYFDAARSYGRAEEWLASWLARRGAAAPSPCIGSKWGYAYTGDWRVQAPHHEVKEHSLPVLRRQVAESRAHLGPHLRLYQVHSVTPESGVLDDAAILQELWALRRTGLRLGLSTSGAHQGEIVDRAVQLRVAGERLFDCVQVTWNLLERSAAPALERAHAAGLGVIVKEALANGRLADRDPEPGFAARAARLRAAAARLGVGMDALGLAAALARPWADVVLSGVVRVEHLRSNLRALDIDWSPALEAELAPVAEESADYWSRRARLRWN
jgi:aryl-alcohol dehydrogenase-like predicted oxidoreductase